ncbi:hypothetical protein C0J52_12406 [Blattella germanica]|nr:hypothetical protein C0J52_12406 [Blattella germanica]
MTGVRRLFLPLRKWSCIWFLCYLGWTLDRVVIVDCQIAFSNTPNYGQLPDILPHAAEKSCFRDTIDYVLQIGGNYTSSIRGPENLNGLEAYSTTYVNEIIKDNKSKLIHHNNPESPISPRILSSLVSQLLVPTSSTVRNELCRNHSRILFERIQRFDMWALKMLDSSAKLPSGILSGNINQYGDFDQCLGVEVHLDPNLYQELEDHHFKGKYCLALIDLDLRKSNREILRHLDNLIFSYRHINSNFNHPGHRVARFSTVNWGFCIPSSCTSEDLEDYLKETLQSQLPDREISVKVKVDANMCYVQDPQPFSLGTKLTIVLFGSIFGIALIATCIDNPEISVKEDSHPDDISCIHGIRALNALALVIFHKSVAFFFNPISNRTSTIKAFDMGWSMMGRTSIIFTDTFILLSGLLTAYNVLKDYEKHKKINIWNKYVARYIRFTPNLLAIILFCTFIMGHLGSGPQWNLVVKHHSDLCQKNLWRNLLYIHNFFGFKNMIQVLVGWSFFLTLGLLAVFGPYQMSYFGYQYNPTEAAYYNAFSPIMWGAFIGWSIFTSSYGYAGYLGDLVCWRGFKIFTHISYAFYLTQFPIFFYNVGLQRIPEYFKPIVLLEIGEILVILLASVILTLLIDIPFQEVKKIIWSPGYSRTNASKVGLCEVSKKELLDLFVKDNSRKLKSKDYKNDIKFKFR